MQKDWKGLVDVGIEKLHKEKIHIQKGFIDEI
jgi:hypothetical protein